MSVTLELVTFVIGFLGIVLGAAASYFGARSAMEVQLARLEERTKAQLESVAKHADRIEQRANDAHDRLDRLFGRRSLAPDSTR